MTNWAQKIAGLFTSHRTHVERVIARRTGDPQVAGDLAQDAFLRLARMPDGEAVDNPAGLLFTVADRIALDHCRTLRRQRLRDGGALGEDIPSPAPGADAVVERNETMARLRGAIDGLSPKTRAVFLLYHAEGLSYRAIAERLEISPRTVEYHLRQALEQCRNHMKRRPPRPGIQSFLKAEFFQGFSCPDRLDKERNRKGRGHALSRNGR